MVSSVLPEWTVRSESCDDVNVAIPVVKVPLLFMTTSYSMTEYPRGSRSMNMFVAADVVCS